MKGQQRGFTLIELMVGVALGLLATVVIAQVFLQSEGNKRTTTGGADAQVSGALALFTMQRDLEMAGYGLAGMPEALGCPVTGTVGGVEVSGFKGSADPLVPVLITFGGATTSSTSDSVSIWSSGKLSYAVPMKLTENHDTTSTSFVVDSTMGVAVGDLLVAIPPASSATAGCTVMAATSDSLGSSTVISHATGNTWSSATAYTAGSVLINLGNTPLRRTYSVDTKNWSLQVADFQAGVATRSSSSQFSQIVLLKALYGKAAAAGGVVTTYEAIPPADNAAWQRVGSIRLVVVARSGQYEKDVVTKTAPQWEAGPLVDGTEACANNASGRCVTLDVSASGPGNVADSKGVVDKEWKHYRYKVFDTVVPLRNMLWMTGPS